MGVCEALCNIACKKGYMNKFLFDLKGLCLINMLYNSGVVATYLYHYQIDFVSSKACPLRFYICKVKT